jgi:hypothetical protein
MKKKTLNLVIIFIMLFLSSCSIGGSRIGMLNRDNTEKNAKAKLEKIIETINNKDKKTLKEMFSKRAINDSVDFDSNMVDLFGFFQGSVESIEKPSGPKVYESNDYGHKKKEVSSYYYVNTDKQRYFFLIRDYPIDTDSPDNVGIYLLLIVRAEDEEKIWDESQKILYDGNKKLSRAGIYIPIK